MNALAAALKKYLQLRRSLGAELQGVDNALRDFVAFATRERSFHVTTDVALRWAQEPREVLPVTWAARLRWVRGFALWLSTTDPRTEVPPAGLLSSRYQRRPPYIFSDAEIAAIIREAGRLASPKGLRGRTYSTIFGLLSVTGMRVTEVLALDREDVDLKEGVLTIRRTKFRKSRLVPLHDSTCRVLAAYARVRDRVIPQAATAAYFLSDSGTRITKWATRCNFAQVSRAVGLRQATPGRRHGHGPRLHDMRHRFAVHTLVEWYRTGVDVERELPKLATYLGHVHVNDTYWYLEAVPELLQLATRRLGHTREGAR